MKHIYPTFIDPSLSARALDTGTLKRSIKDALRVQSTVIGTHGGTAAAFINLEPDDWTRWAGNRYANFEWLQVHLTMMSFEWKARHGGNFHEDHKAILELSKQRHIVPDMGQMTMFPNCTRFVHLIDPTVAYRLALCERWARDPAKVMEFGEHGPPPWIVPLDDLPRVRAKLGCSEPPTCN